MLVFVYGTLKEGYGNHRHHLQREGVNYKGEYITPAEWTMFSLGGFPGVMKGGNTPITGEVYEIDKEVFRGLDRLEGFPRFYDRDLIKTPYGAAWIYYLKDQHYRASSPKIEDGVWR